MMIPPSPTLLIAAANTYVGWEQDEEGSRLARRSAFIERILTEVSAKIDGVAPVPWHTAFVSHVGYWSHFDRVYGLSSWPLPATASANDLGKFAEERGVLVKEPKVGDLFLYWAPVKQEYVRTGIVVRLGDYGVSLRGTPYLNCEAIEGNTNEDRDEDGTLTLQQDRRLSVESGDRFIRWWDLDVRAERVAGSLLRGAERAELLERLEAEERAEEGT